MLQQGNYSNSSNVGHTGLSMSNTSPIVNEDEVLVGKELPVYRTLTSRRYNIGISVTIIAHSTTKSKVFTSASLMFWSRCPSR